MTGSGESVFVTEMSAFWTTSSVSEAELLPGTRSRPLGSVVIETAFTSAPTPDTWPAATSRLRWYVRDASAFSLVVVVQLKTPALIVQSDVSVAVLV